MPSMLSKQIIRLTNGIVSEYNVQKNLASALQGRKLDPIKKYCVCLILQTQAAPGTVQAHKIEQISKHLQSYSSIIGNFAATVFFKDLERSSMVKGAWGSTEISCGQLISTFFLVLGSIRLSLKLTQFAGGGWHVPSTLASERQQNISHSCSELKVKIECEESKRKLLNAWQMLLRLA